MIYKQIKPKKIYEEVADAIYEMIRNGTLKQGDKLDSVQQLAENFQVGRSAIREALSALKAMGLIEMKQGEGTFVKSFNPTIVSLPMTMGALLQQEDYQHMIEMRHLLEVSGVELAAVRRTDEDLQRMRQALDEMRHHMGANLNDSGGQLDFNFHLALAHATKNPIFLHFMNHLSTMMVDVLKETRRLTIEHEAKSEHELYDEHEAIYEAIRIQNRRQARFEMERHLARVTKFLT